MPWAPRGFVVFGCGFVGLGLFFCLFWFVCLFVLVHLFVILLVYQSFVFVGLCVYFSGILISFQHLLSFRQLV